MSLAPAGRTYSWANENQESLSCDPPNEVSNQSIHQPINQSVYQSINQFINQSISWLIH